MRRLNLLAIAMLLLCFEYVQSQTNIYVSPDGDDSNAGTLSAPLKSLKGARNKVRSQGSAGGATVYFRGGRYSITETTVMEAQDGGASGNPIVYTTYNNEKVIFDGSVMVDPTRFQLVTDGSLLSRMHNNANGKVYSQVITDNNLKNLLKKATPILTMNDRLLTIARFPNSGFGHIDQSTLSGGYETVNTTGTNTSPKGGRFKLHESFNTSKWEAEIKRNYKAQARGYMSANWLKETITVVSGTNGYLRLKDGTKYGLDRMESRNWPNRIFIMQLLCELDSPGEWYFDDEDSRLYIYPVETINSNSVIGVGAGPQVIEVNNASNITFEKFIIQNIGDGRGGKGAINVLSGSNIKVAGITFMNIAEPYTACNFWNDVKNSTIISCNFYDVWNSVRLYGGSYGQSSITKGNNRIENCHFTQIYSQDLYGKAIGIRGAGHTIKNNLIHNMNGQPVTYRGVDHIFQYNEIFNVGIEEGDGGAVYQGGDIFSFGNEHKHNFLHHIISIPGLNGRNGYYSDDHDGGEKYIENVFYKCGYNSIYCNKGPGHTIQRNVIIDAHTGVYIGTGNASHFDKAKDYLKNDPNSTAKENYIGRAEKVIGDFADNNAATYNSSWDNSFWAQRYPYLKNSLKQSNYLGMYPTQVRIYDNMYTGQVATVKKGPLPTIRDPRYPTSSAYVDYNSLNFKFKEPRPSYAPAIPFEQIGLYNDDYRCNVPNKNTYRRAIQQKFSGKKPYDASLSYNRNTINDYIYYNSGKVVTDLINTCYNDRDDGNSGGGTAGWFDLGTTTSPVFNGYIRVSQNTTSGSYRWTNGNNLDSRDRGTGANNLNRDFVFSDQARTFEYTTANGTYDVVVTLGDLSGAHDNMVIKAEGTTVKSDIDRAAGQIANETFQVTVNDGKLSLEFSDAGGSNQHWVVNRIKIDPATTTCNPTAISPYIQVDGGAWQQIANVTVSSGATVVFGPQPTTGGTWNWSGCGTSGSSRGQTINPTSTCTSTATYTNACGAETQQQFVVTVSGGGTPGGQTPYGGSNRTIPGTIEAEDFDNGGEGVAYHDTDATNKGNNVAREDEGVDIEARDGSNSIGWVANGEWLEYTVNATAGTYKIEARVASNASGKKMIVKLGGTTLGTITAPNTGGWGTFQTVSIDNITIAGGNNKVLRLEFDGGSINLNWVKFTSGGTTPPPSGNPIVVEAESLADNGGTYNDGHVPVGVGVNPGVGINWLNNGDWAEYNVSIPTDGEYEIVYNIASPNNNTTIQFSIDGTPANTTTVPNTGGWETYNSLTASDTENLTAGTRTIRLTAGPTTWTWNLDKFTLTRLGEMKSAEIISTPFSFNVYPNPAKEILNISINSSIEDNASITIYSSVGTKLKMETIADVHHQVSLSELGSGMYILQIINGNDILTKRFIKK